MVHPETGTQSYSYKEMETEKSWKQDKGPISVYSIPAIKDDFKWFGCKNPCVVPPLEGANEQAASGTNSVYF